MASRRIRHLQIEPAQRLSDVYRTMSPQPLRTAAELEHLYEPSINQARGADLAESIALELNRQHGSDWYKLFFYGSRGSGKSTEMSRLLQKVEDNFRGVRIDVRQELNPVEFQPHEILITIALAFVKATADLIQETNGQVDLDPMAFYKIESWFEQTEYIATTSRERSSGAEVSGAAVLPFLRLFEKLGLSVSGSMKANYATREEVKAKRRTHYSDLIGAVNSLIATCNEMLVNCTDKELEWVVLLEDLDKATPLPVLSTLIYDNSHIFSDIETHFICNLPLGLLSGRSVDGTDIPFRTMYDTPVYTENYSVHVVGRQSIEHALAHRINLDLFSAGQVNRLVVASGGSLRHLFEMTVRAADHASLRLVETENQDDTGQIVETDITKAIQQERQDFRLALGEDISGQSGVTREQKRDRLEEIYNRKPGHSTPDAVMNELLKSKAVQSFNGSGRYAVHPIVVDLLYEDKVIGDGLEKVPGGLI